MRVAIVADDLTGAADCALQCRRAGLSARVVLDPAPVSAEAASTEEARAAVTARAREAGAQPEAVVAPGVQAVAFDTDSRALAPDLAAARVARLAAALSTQPWDIIYKKIDSTLRGNIGAELAALAGAIAPELVVIAPAFPAAGRQVIGGQVLVDGRPLHTTDASRDPSSPVRTSSVIERLWEQLGQPVEPEERRGKPVGRPGLPVGRLGLPAGVALGEPVVLGAPGPEEPAAAIGARLVALSRAGRRLIACDAATDADLAAIVRGVRASGLRVVWAGSAGLMAQLVAADGEPKAVWPGELGGGRVLLVAGSLHARTHRQLARLRREPGVGYVAVEAAGLLDPARREREVAQALEGVRRAVNDGRHVALATRAAPADLERAAAASARLGLERGAAAGQIAAGLATIAARATAVHGFARLVLTGGDVARAVCTRLGVAALELAGALEAGIPLARTVPGGGGDRPLWLITKAGGFGTDEALVRAVRRLGEGGVGR